MFNDVLVFLYEIKQVVIVFDLYTSYFHLELACSLHLILFTAFTFLSQISRTLYDTYNYLFCYFYFCFIKRVCGYGSGDKKY